MSRDMLLKDKHITVEEAWETEPGRFYLSQGNFLSARTMIHREYYGIQFTIIPYRENIRSSRSIIY